MTRGKPLIRIGVIHPIESCWIAYGPNDLTGLKRAELDRVYAGDIAAVVGLRNTSTGDTICDENHPVILESMEFPEPVIELAIEPTSKAGQQKLGEALNKLSDEDPTFRAHTNRETG